MLVVTLLVAKESCSEDYLVLVVVFLFQSESYKELLGGLIHEAFLLLNSLQRFLSALTSHLVEAIGI